MSETKKIRAKTSTNNKKSNQLVVAKPSIVPLESNSEKTIREIYASWKETQASSSYGDLGSSYLESLSPHSKINSDLQNINDGISPWNNTCDCVDVKDAIILCQKAYWNVSIFRQTIDVQSEFSNSDLYFEGENKEAVRFFSQWDSMINGWSHRDQFFREYFRSSCIFLYRIDSELKDFDVKRQSPTIRVKNPDIPIRYILLNPADIKAGNAADFINSIYYKFLNNYEIKRLKLPREKLTEQEKAIYDQLEPSEKEKLKKSLNQEHIKLKLDPSRLHTVFAKKQDYEPLAVPMYFPVLYDINLKLQLKKAESIIARTIDHAVLLITVGDEESGPEVNQQLIDEMNLLFRQESVGRIVVADYTTKMSFVTPDLNKILGSEKYETVNKDIADGLMNIFFKEEKFSNSSIKIKVFMERLKEARTSYLENFLKPEMKRIAKELGFKSVPEPKFKEIDLKDEFELYKIYNRLAELGLLTPEELFNAYEGKKMPLPEDSVSAQKEFKKLKEEGLYEPIIGAKKTSGAENGGGREPGQTVKDQNKKPTGEGTKSSFDQEKHQSSFLKLKEVVAKADKVFNKVQESYKTKNKIKRLSKRKKDLAYLIAKNIYISEDIDKWEESVDEYIENPLLQKEIKEEIIELAEAHDVSEVNAAFLYYSKL